MASIEIFIGAPIEHASERATLARAYEFLSAQGIPAVILANLSLDERQIDLVMAIDRAALVAESKGFTSGVRGGHNGDWEVRLASSIWKKFEKPYLQAMNEKLALRDAMRSFAGAEVPYPDAALIFVPAIPAESTVPPGDFKVSIGGLDDLPGLIASMKRDGWSLDQWRAFAAYHRLVPAPSIDAALSPELIDAGQLLKTYCEAFIRTYGGPASAMVPTSCVYEDQALSSDDVLKRSAQDDNTLLTGPSGCGKSLLGYAIGLAGLARGDVPIIIPAKDFEGNLRDVVTYPISARIAKVSLAGDEAIPIVRSLVRKMMAAVRRYDIYAYDQDDLMTGLLQVRPTVVLDEAFSGDAKARDNAVQVFSDFQRFQKNPMGVVSHDVLLAWCDADPAIRYPMMAASATLFKRPANGEPHEWLPLAAKLLAKAPDPPAVLKEIVRRLHPTSWSGSLATKLEGRLRLLEQLPINQISTLVGALNAAKAVLQERFATERKREATESRSRNRRFED